MNRAILTICILAICANVLAQSSIVDSLHNLSSTGPGEFKSETTTQICVFCHTPHTSTPDAPLWNRPSKGYWSKSATSEPGAPGEPSGPSLLCLSCHDGTVALGDLISPPRVGRTRNSDLRNTFLRGRSNLGMDLTDDHPVSMRYEANSGTRRGLAKRENVKLPFPDGKVQCTSCHDPHRSQFPPFLHQSTINGTLCISCHELKGESWDWQSSGHAQSRARARGANPWNERKPEWQGQDVAENACHNCHAPHNAETPRALVKKREENTCYSCHNGTVAADNIQSEHGKISRHPVEAPASMGHDSAQLEDPLNMSLHVECEDCHNPHATRNDKPMISFDPSNPMSSDHTEAPNVNGNMVGVPGLDISGEPVAESEFQYEVCFKCHGVPGRNVCDNRRCSTALQREMVRQDGVYNIRDKVNPGNPLLISYHPIDLNNPLNDEEVPSLRLDTPLNRTSSRIYCTDCHSGDNSPSAGNGNTRGPHGSRYEPLLALDYELDPDANYNANSARLCFKCHDAGSLFGNDSFPHRQHTLANRASCVNCHDPHGSASYPHLINFLTSSNVGGQVFEITGTGFYPEPTWEDNGLYSGTCYLNCHGVEHDGVSY